MPIETGFGSTAVTQSYTDQYVYSDGIALPSGRAMANGSRACLVTGVRAYASGRGAARSVSIAFGPNTTPAFTVGAAGSAQNTGWIDIRNFLVEGGSTRFRLNFNGSTYFGRSGSGTATDSYGTTFGMLAGGYQWAQSPSSPRLTDVTPRGTDGTIRVNFDAAADNGGVSIRGYHVQWSASSTFGSNLDAVDTTRGEVDVSNLAPGQRYWFRIAAMNAVTDAANTFGPWSNVISAVAPGAPSAPRNLAAYTYTTQLDTMRLTWDKPSNVAGGITGYNIYDGDDLFVKAYGDITEYKVTDLVKNKQYRWSLRARNDWADANNTAGPYSSTVPVWNYSTPSAPRNLTAVANAAVAGRIDLTWNTPTTVGAGITKYSVYASTGKKIADVPATTLTYSVTGLTPGLYYAFYIYAWTAVAEGADTPGPASATVGDTAVGLPGKPTKLTVTSSSAVPGRLTLSWTLAAGYTGFNVYEILPSGTVLRATVATPKIIFDGVSPTSHTYLVAARNIVTDTATPPTEGPRSDAASGTPGVTASIAVPAFSVPDITNTMYNGTYTINTITPKSLTYTLSAPDQPQTNVPSGVGIVTDNTNAALSGTHAITATGTTTFSFAQTGSNIPANTAVANVTASNTTNQTFNGTYSVTAVDATNFTVSYANTGADFTQAVASGTVTNRSNTVYNGTGLTIISVPATNQFTYNKTNADLAETTASGTATDTTNRDFYNATPEGRGSATVLTTPTYNTLTYSLNTALTQSSTTLTSPYGTAYRATSKSSLTIKYRSGWAG